MKNKDGPLTGLQIEPAAAIRESMLLRHDIKEAPKSMATEHALMTTVDHSRLATPPMSSFCAPFCAQKRQWLAQIVWGHQMRWYFRSKGEWDRSKEAFAESFYVDDWLEQVATSEMVSHRFLTDEVEETVFDNGLTLRINFSKDDYDLDGVCIPSLGYRISEGA